MFTSISISTDRQRAVMLRSFHDRAKRNIRAGLSAPRSISEYGSKSYRDSLQRAFNRAKTQIFFNPDMTNFITLTYRGVNHTPEQVMADIKALLLKESRHRRDSSPDGQSGAKEAKYLWIMEYQKRGSIHVHMIANDCFTLQVNANGYRELKFWRRGFTSVLTINDFDSNFRPYLYLFKYMRKSQRIGKSFVHTSRNLGNFATIPTHEVLDIAPWSTVTQEHLEAWVGNSHLTFIRNFLVYDDILKSQQLNPPQIGQYNYAKNRQNHPLRGQKQSKWKTI